jgi:hypothetical protein
MFAELPRSEHRRADAQLSQSGRIGLHLRHVGLSDWAISSFVWGTYVPWSGWRETAFGLNEPPQLNRSRHYLRHWRFTILGSRICRNSPWPQRRVLACGSDDSPLPLVRARIAANCTASRHWQS